MAYDLFDYQRQQQAIENIQRSIADLHKFEVIETIFCTIEKSTRFYVVKTIDFDIAFQSISDVLDFIECASKDGWEHAYSLEKEKKHQSYPRC